MTAEVDSSHADSRLAQLLEELLDRARKGDFPGVEWVVAEHPEFADELRGLWATAMLAQQLGPSAMQAGQNDALVEDGQPPPGIRDRRVGDYELLDEVGRGGMGVVYRARQVSLDRIVALKMILAGSLASDTDVKRFRAEAEAVAQLDHPHIIPVYEVGEYGDQPWYSMKFIEGETLARRLAERPLPDREAARILLAVSRAVSAAHAGGVLHRDLKASNILIDTAGHVYISDFGLARRVPARGAGQADGEADGEAAMSQEWESLTRTGAIVGTPAWMAPEQAGGHSASIGAATDVYGLGALLYAMLTGRPPFQSASPVDTLRMVLEQDPVEPRVLNKQVHSDLQMICMKCLQKPADLRYQSADALTGDLEAFLADEPVSARSSHFPELLNRVFRESHHAAILHNWGLLWMWHSLVLLLLCLVTNWLQYQSVSARWPYSGMWGIGLSVWAIFFWNARRRAGPITFVERQIAHVWVGSMAASILLFGIEAILDLPVLSLSPVLGLIAGTVFLAKAGILSGRFYVQAVVLLVTALVMAWLSRGGEVNFSLTIFGIVSAVCFFIPGLRAWRERRDAADSVQATS